MRKKCLNCPHSEPYCVGRSFPVKKFSKKKILADILTALKELYCKDFDLIKRNAHERCISARFYAYFERLFSEKYKDLNIDPEYNKNGVDPKYYGYTSDDRYTYAFPDVIVHKRDCNRHNTIYMEFKPIKNRPEADFKKLKYFTSNSCLGYTHDDRELRYAYKHGVGIAYGVDEVKFFYFTGGDGPIHEKSHDTSSWENKEQVVDISQR